jgi:hypothetical protein
MHHPENGRSPGADAEYKPNYQKLLANSSKY